jgi:hypothetical protein
VQESDKIEHKLVEVDQSHHFRVFVSDEKGIEALIQCLREAMKGKEFMFNAEIKYVELR